MFLLFKIIIDFGSLDIQKYHTKSFSPYPFKSFKIFTTSRPATAVASYKGALRQDEVCQIFKEVEGTVRRENATELENPLHL